MMYYLWRALAICIVLGSIQWMYTHPDSEMTQNAKFLWYKITETWDLIASLVMDFIHGGLDVKPAKRV